MQNTGNIQKYTVRGEAGTLEVRVGPNTIEDSVRSSSSNKNPENHNYTGRVELRYEDSDGKATKEIIVDGQVVFRGGNFKVTKDRYKGEASYDMLGLSSLFPDLVEWVPSEIGQVLQSCYADMGIKR